MICWCCKVAPATHMCRGHHGATCHEFCSDCYSLHLRTDVSQRDGWRFIKRECRSCRTPYLPKHVSSCICSECGKTKCTACADGTPVIDYVCDLCLEEYSRDYKAKVDKVVARRANKS